MDPEGFAAWIQLAMYELLKFFTSSGKELTCN
jgi:hypothetical protein